MRLPTWHSGATNRGFFLPGLLAGLVALSLFCMPCGADASTSGQATQTANQNRAKKATPSVGTAKGRKGAVAATAKSAKKTQPAKAKEQPKTVKNVAPNAVPAPTPKTQPDAPKTFPVAKATLITPAEGAKLPVMESWKPLMQRLSKDGIDGVFLRHLFGRMGDSYSHVPMGTKINELFTYKYMEPLSRKLPTAGTPSARPSVYRSMVTPASVGLCREYLLQHAVAFGAMEAKYGVPKEIVVGLLMVETRLGRYLGDSSSFWSLACMAAADSPERVDVSIQSLPLPMTPDRMEWLKGILRERSNWAYKELLALARHSQANSLDPLVMPGSVYGAIGICQFMPSNLHKYAVDGNNDGKVDLFDPADAIPSVANYLKEHGWKGEERTVRHSAIKRYNKSNVYANTILAISDALTAPPDGVTATASVSPKKIQAATKKAQTNKRTAKQATADKATTKPTTKSVRKSPASKTTKPDPATKADQTTSPEGGKVSPVNVFDKNGQPGSSPTQGKS